MASVSRRTALTGLSSSAIAAGFATPAFAQSAAPHYRQVMGQQAAAEAADGMAAAEQWCQDEEAALRRLAATQDGLRDLLEKVAIVAERSRRNGWDLMDAEAALFVSMGRQARALLREGVV